MASYVEEIIIPDIIFDITENEMDDSDSIASQAEHEISEKELDAEIETHSRACFVNFQNSEEDCRNEGTQTEPTIVLDPTDITPNRTGGVLKQLVKKGEGEECPGFGDKVSVRYSGWILDSEARPTFFEGNRDGEKCEFNLGRGTVIKGWDVAIRTMKKKEVSLYIFHPHYAYGQLGRPPKIPVFATLMFEIELLGWKLEDLSPKKDNGILRKVIDKGEGCFFPNEGSKMRIKLIGYYNDRIFERRKRKFVLGEGHVAGIPEGIEIALLKFRSKEKSMLYLKSKYAFDTNGAPQHGIPPGADLRYEVKLLMFDKIKDVWEMNSDEKLKKARAAKEKGLSYYQAGNFKSAIKQFKWIQSCLEDEPGAPVDSENIRKLLLLSGYLNITLCLLKQENYIDAIKMCDKALELDPENEKALYRRGQAKILINECEEALRDIQKLLSVNPKNKAATKALTTCKEGIRKQNLKDKKIYHKMFEKFVKQDASRRDASTETGVWQNGKGNRVQVEHKGTCMTETERLIERNNSALRDANIIELSNTAK